MLNGQISALVTLFLLGSAISGAYLAFGLLASLMVKPVSDPKVNLHTLRQKIIVFFVAGVWLEILAIGIKVIWR